MKFAAPSKVLDVPHASSLVSDGANLWWTTSNLVGTARLDGSGAKILATFPAGDSWRVVAAHQNDVFVAASRGGFDECSFLMIGMNGTRTELAPKHCVERAATNSHYLTWVRVQIGEFGDRIPSLWVAPIAGGKPHVLPGINAFGSIVLQEGALWYRGKMSEISSVEMNGQPTGDPPSRAPTSNVRAASPNGSGIHSFAVDGNDVYALYGDPNFAGYDLILVPARGESKLLAKTAIPANMNGHGIPAGDPLIVGQYVYWTLPDQGLVRRASTTGECPAEDVATQQLNPDHLLVLGQELFWINGSNGDATDAIMKLPLPAVVGTASPTRLPSRALGSLDGDTSPKTSPAAVSRGPFPTIAAMCATNDRVVVPLLRAKFGEDAFPDNGDVSVP